MRQLIRGLDIKSRPYDDPVEFFEPYAEDAMSVLLTGGTGEERGRYSIAGIDPVIRCHFDSAFYMETSRGKEKLSDDLWEGLRQMTDMEKSIFNKHPASLCGAIGYIGYDACHTVEQFTSTVKKAYDLPLAHFVYYGIYIVWDHKKQMSHEIRPEYSVKPLSSISSKKEDPAFSLENLTGECSKETYMDKVRIIQEYIRDGYVYEVNLSQLFRGDFTGSSFTFFKKIYRGNPAPFSAFMNHGDIVITCNSPEMFMICEDGVVETRPIKGTAPRGKNEDEDHELKKALLESEKEKAELYMITDLLRNDLNKACVPGSVEVSQKRHIEAYRNVFQAVSTIRGKLSHDRDIIDLLKGSFPGGSITGCPKYSCLKVIDELEQHARGLYTGSIMVLNSQRLMSNIVIRTAVITGGRCFINSGGAVTIDSDPESEYDEIMAKISNFIKAAEI